MARQPIRPPPAGSRSLMPALPQCLGKPAHHRLARGRQRGRDEIDRTIDNSSNKQPSTARAATGSALSRKSAAEFRSTKSSAKPSASARPIDHASQPEKTSSEELHNQSVPARPALTPAAALPQLLTTVQARSRTQTTRCRIGERSSTSDRYGYVRDPEVFLRPASRPIRTTSTPIRIKPMIA